LYSEIKSLFKQNSTRVNRMSVTKVASRRWIPSLPREKPTRLLKNVKLALCKLLDEIVYHVDSVL